jgi:hypothetical protein
VRNSTISRKLIQDKRTIPDAEHMIPTNSVPYMVQIANTLGSKPISAIPRSWNKLLVISA